MMDYVRHGNMRFAGSKFARAFLSTKAKVGSFCWSELIVTEVRIDVPWSSADGAVRRRGLSVQ